MKKITAVILTTVMLLLCSIIPAAGESDTVPPVSDTSYDSYENGYGNAHIVSVDSLGRVYLPGVNNEKQVGIFSALWMGQPMLFDDIWNSGEILKMENGEKLMFGIEEYDPAIAPNGQFYYPIQPLWGYYNSADEWVIRRHLIMLGYIGVDFIMFDTTNAVTYETVYKKYMSIAAELIDSGLPSPYICFYTHSKSIYTVETLYSEIYSTGAYRSSWYQMDGKPLIIAYDRPARDIIEALGRKDQQYRPDPYPQEILDFFTFRDPVWPGERNIYFKTSIPWMDWSFPLNNYGGFKCVSVATHNHPPYSCTVTHGDSWGNCGRGYSFDLKKNVTEDAQKGTFYQALWDNAMDAEAITLCNWAGSLSVKTLTTDYGLNEYTLCDSLNAEFSNDIEPMKGDYGDNFYVQTAINIRKFKNSGKTLSPAVKLSINIGTDLMGWGSCNAVFRDGKANAARNYVGSAKTVSYTQAAPLNDITEIRVTNDADNIYMLAIAAEDIKQGDNFMNVLIGTGKPSMKGFAGYDYILKYNGTDFDIIKANADFTGEKVGEAKCALNGRTLEYSIPKAALGMTADDFYFKVADGVEHPEDIMDYYLSGECLPLGRMSYYYAG